MDQILGSRSTPLAHFFKNKPPQFFHILQFQFQRRPHIFIPDENLVSRFNGRRIVKVEDSEFFEAFYFVSYRTLQEHFQGYRWQISHENEK